MTGLYALLRAIDETMPDDAILFVEGTSIVPEIKRFLESRRPERGSVRRVALGTFFSEPETFHVPLHGTNLADLRALAENHAEPEVCDHIAVYHEDDLLLSCHDAGDGYVEIARRLPEAIRRRFRASLGDPASI